MNDDLVKTALLESVQDFMKSNRITCAETIHQCDWVIENAYSFIEELCEIVGYPEDEEENEDVV